MNSRSTIDPEEVARFSALADEWWDPHGKFKPLHKFNPVRLSYIQEKICAQFKLAEGTNSVFKGLRILDIGCGGGLLSEPMARLGAEIVGADPSRVNIETARIHAESQGLDIDYRCTTSEELAEAGETFDVVLNMEVIEHVADPALFIESCATMVRPGGLMIAATLNRTVKAFALAIVGAEYILRWLKPGTHTWEKFVTPEEFNEFLKPTKLRRTDLTGVAYNPLADSWRRTSDVDVNYMITTARKKPSATAKSRKAKA